MIRIGIVGYGNLGKGVENAINAAEDLELCAVFTRRNPELVDTNAKVYKLSDIENEKDNIDVLILCGSSDKDIEVQGPDLIKNFNLVDCFDTHSHVPEYFSKMNDLSNKSNHVSIISTGWDPGFFSLMRTLNDAFLPNSSTYTFWGKGLSQGHGAAVRSIDGVKDAVQYTIPKQAYLESVRNGENPDYTAQLAHDREVFVVLEENADKDKVEEAIKTMPAYFEGYDTRVNFISQEELNENHSGMPHGGKIISTGKTGGNTVSKIEFSLDLESNPDFTAQIAVAYARACFRLYEEGKYGANTVLDVAPKYLSARSYEELIHHFI